MAELLLSQLGVSISKRYIRRLTTTTSMGSKCAKIDPSYNLYAIPSNKQQLLLELRVSISKPYIRRLTPTASDTFKMCHNPSVAQFIHDPVQQAAGAPTPLTLAGLNLFSGPSARTLLRIEQKQYPNGSHSSPNV